MLNLKTTEEKIFRKLNTPAKIQDFLSAVPANFETKGETLYSPRMLLAHNRAHCMEGALFALAVLHYYKQKAFLLDLRSTRPDFDHVVTLFSVDGHFGAISKSNHSVLQYRDPIYKSVRELVMSYFHEYFLSSNGKKTLRDYSKPFDIIQKFGTDWIVSTEDLWPIDRALDKSPHIKILTPKQIKNLRLADSLEIAASDLIRFKK